MSNDINVAMMVGTVSDKPWKPEFRGPANGKQAWGTFWIETHTEEEGLNFPNDFRISVVLFGHKAEDAYEAGVFRSGTRVKVAGYLRQRKYTRNDRDEWRTELHVSRPIEVIAESPVVHAEDAIHDDPVPF